MFGVGEEGWGGVEGLAFVVNNVSKFSSSYNSEGQFHRMRPAF